MHSSTCGIGHEYCLCQHPAYGSLRKIELLCFSRVQSLAWKTNMFAQTAWCFFLTICKFWNFQNLAFLCLHIKKSRLGFCFLRQKLIAVLRRIITSNYAFKHYLDLLEDSDEKLCIYLKSRGYWICIFLVFLRLHYFISLKPSCCLVYHSLPMQFLWRMAGMRQFP